MRLITGRAEKDGILPEREHCVAALQVHLPRWLTVGLLTPSKRSQSDNQVQALRKSGVPEVVAIYP